MTLDAKDMDLLPKIVEAARKMSSLRVLCERPAKMAAELRKHLPEHIVTVEGNSVFLVSRRLPINPCSNSEPSCR